MPGFTLIYQPEGLTESLVHRAKRLVDVSFKVEFISRTEQLIVLFRDGNHYPYEVIKAKEYIAVIEGKIFNIASVHDDEFKRHIDEVYHNPDPQNSLSYFHQLDGEFIIYILDKKGHKHFILNDYLGRLPAYLYRGRQFIFSRDMYVLDKVTTGLMFDEQSVYQFLRLGFPVGNRTLYHDIERFEPASLLTIKNEEVGLQSNPPDLSALQASYTSPKPEVALYELFRTALKTRLEKEKKIMLSLSGGLDSRIIMGEINKLNYPVDYASFEYDNAIIHNDIKVVKQLARHYDKSPQIIALNEWSPELFDELTNLKGGMNYLGMSFILNFLSQLGATHNLMLTGDGGDKTLPWLFPSGRLKTKNLARGILKRNSLISARLLEDFLIADTEPFEAELREYLNALPGKSAQLRYKQFMVFERAMHWLFEGEDRNRNYIWSSSPFYDPAFFNLVHSIPEKEKKNFNLFRKFIRLVDPKLNAINNANWGIPLDDQKKVNQMLWRQALKQKIPFRRGQSGHKTEMQKMLVDHVSAMLQKGYGAQVFMNSTPSDLAYAGPETLFHLLTILKVSEMTWKTQ